MSEFEVACIKDFFYVAVMRTEFPYFTSITGEFLSTILADDNALRFFSTSLGCLFNLIILHLSEQNNFFLTPGFWVIKIPQFLHRGFSISLSFFNVGLRVRSLVSQFFLQKIFAVFVFSPRAWQSDYFRIPSSTIPESFSFQFLACISISLSWNFQRHHIGALYITL